MQCNQCGANLAPAADACATCAAPAPSPLGSPRTRAAEPPPLTPSSKKKDISWLVFILISLPFLLLAGVRSYSGYAGDPSKAQGAIAGTVAVAAGIAWVIYRLFKTRYRLTWAVTYAVLVVVSLVPTLATTAGTPDASAPEASAPDASASASVPQNLNITWPTGWTVTRAEVPPNMHAVNETAMLVEGQRLTAITAAIWPDFASRSLGDSAKATLEGLTEAATEKGATLSVTGPTDGTWGGRPMVQYEVLFTLNGRTVHQHLLTTRGPDNLTCALTYQGTEAEFTTHFSEFETIKNAFVCP